jgi:hypothetical protein
MQNAAAIHESARRLEEALTVFRFKSRNALEEYDELAGHWNDSRGQQFAIRHVNPQQELVDQGGRLCGLLSERMRGAQVSANEAENEMSSFVAADTDFEMAATDTRSASHVARETATRVVHNASKSTEDLKSIDGGIAAAAQDPGW